MIFIWSFYGDSLISDDLLLRLDFRDPDPVVIDLSPVGGVVSTLKESKIECMSADKVISRSLDCEASNLTFVRLAIGCLSLLLPFAVSGEIISLPFLDRRNTAAYAADGITQFESLPSTLPTRAASTPKEP